ncbi:MAG: hypothetical protein QM756_26540 [Polyangiaceae bacterium]
MSSQAQAIAERAEHLARRKELYEALHPETKHGGDHGNQHAGGKVRNPQLGSAFVDDTAAKTGRSSRVIHEEVQVAKSLTPATKDAVRGTPLEDRKDRPARFHSGWLFYNFSCVARVAPC